MVTTGEVRFETLRSLEDAYALWAQVRLRIGDVDSAREQSWRRYFERYGDRFLAAYASSGILVGTAVVFFDGRKGSVYRVAVKEEWRRKGIASRLISLAETTASSCGADSIYVLIESDSIASGNLFSERGYDSMDTVRYFNKRLRNE